MIHKLAAWATCIWKLQYSLCATTQRYTESLKNLTYSVGAEVLMTYSISSKLPHYWKYSGWVETALSRWIEMGLPSSFHTYIVAKCLVPKCTSRFPAIGTGLWGNMFSTIYGCHALNLRVGFTSPSFSLRQGTSFKLLLQLPLQSQERGRDLPMQWFMPTLRLESKTGKINCSLEVPFSFRFLYWQPHI